MSGSLSSLAKGLNAFFASAQRRLSDDQTALIESYIEKHAPAKESDRRRLHEELISIHNHHVNENNSASFLHILAILKHDYIITPEACATWWNRLLLPIINQPDLLKETLRDSMSICLDTLVISDEDEEFKTRYAAAEQLKACIFESYFDAVSSQRIKVAENLQHLLNAFARRRAKEYFEAVDPFLQNPQRRLHTLTLLSAFVRLQTQYIYQIVDTPLLNSLLLCLEHDTSTTVVSLALTVLIMIVPHVPDRLGKMLSRLFGIFGRVLCWDRLLAVRRRTNALVDVEKSDQEQEEKQPTSENLPEGHWSRLDASFDASYSTPPKCSQYFTFLYGLYPINFLAFLRAPSEYAKAEGPKSIEIEGDEFEDEMIRTRAEPFVRRHLVHPNLTLYTRETETSDISRWMKMESADVVALCISLDTVNHDPEMQEADTSAIDQDTFSPSLGPGTAAYKNGDDKTQARGHKGPHPPPSQEQVDQSPIRSPQIRESFALEDIDPEIASRVASPAFAPRIITNFKDHTVVSRHSSTSQRSMIGPSDVLSTHEILVNTSQDSRDFDGPWTSPSQSDSETRSVASFYHREVLLLKNELRFERHLRQQQLQHIGRLQRERISDAALESERQNLYNSTRALKSQVGTLQAVLKNLRSEASTSKANRTQYEASLNDRIKKLRDEKSNLLSKESALQDALNLANKDVANMQIALGIAEGTALNLRQQLKVLEPEIQDTKQLRANFELLKQRIKEAEIQDVQLKMEKERVTEAQAQAKSATIRFEALKEEFDQYVRSTKDSRSLTEGEMRPALTNSRETLQGDTIRSLMAKAAADATAIETLQERHTSLYNKCNQLQLQISDLEAEIEATKLSSNHTIALSPRSNSSATRPSSASFRSLPTKSAVQDPASPQINVLAANPKFFETEEHTHGARRLRMGKTVDDAASLASSESPSKAKSAKSPTPSPLAKAPSDPKERTSLSNRFRW